MCKLTQLTIVTFLLATTFARAEERKRVPTAPISLDENGFLIVPVTLHSMKMWDVTRTFRFLLDTGSSTCIVDKTLPSEFFWDEPDIETTARDIANQAVLAPSVLLKRVEVGRVMRDGVFAVRMDLYHQLGKIQDHPVDGILGMSFLRGTRFLLDPQASRLVWWESVVHPGVTIPILDSPGGPYMNLRLGNQLVQATLDTGMTGGIDLPMTFNPKGEGGKTSISIGLSGVQVAGLEGMIPRMEAGTGAWTNLPVTFRAGVNRGGVGLDVWLAAPACFDFITNHLTLSVDSEGHLPIRSAPNKRLPIGWDRSQLPPRLVILFVKPGSALDKVGARVGDELRKVGSLEGKALNRQAIQDLVASGEECVWVVRRNGEEHHLKVGGR